jgi:hypothetical protein
MADATPNSDRAQLCANLYDAEYKQLFLELLCKHVEEAQKPRRKPSREWCANWVSVGKAYKAGGRMIVGRAVNGWKNTKFCLQEVQTKEGKEKLVASCCQSFVDEFAYGKPCSISSIGRMARRVADGPRDWGSCWNEPKIAWSNLMKISPEKGGNPPEWSFCAQLPTATQLLKLELARLAPSLVVFLTGMRWFEPFLEPLGAHVERTKDCQFVLLCGHLGESIIIVSEHPARRPEEELESEIRRCAGLQVNS